jgi:predicted metal-dependent peptidase
MEQTCALAYEKGRFTIACVASFMEKLTVPERMAVLKHESAHFVNKHMVRRAGRDPIRWNFAGDMAINQDIQGLPSKCIKLPENWPARVATEVYYDLLNKEAKKKGTKNGEESGGEGGQGQSKRNKTGDKASDLYDWVCDVSPTVSQDVSSLSDGILRDIVSNRLANGAKPDKLRGLYAGALDQFLDELTAKPIINWRQATNRFVSSLSDSKSTITLKRPDRRGIAPYGKKHEKMPRLVVAIDTSGSVDDALLATFLGQVVCLGYQLSEIQVIIADAEIQDSYLFTKGKVILLKKSAKGRGGTDFDPAVIYMNQYFSDFDGAIYLTDGYCPVPKTKSKIPLLWIVTGNDSFEGKPSIKLAEKDYRK